MNNPKFPGDGETDELAYERYRRARPPSEAKPDHPAPADRPGSTPGHAASQSSQPDMTPEYTQPARAVPPHERYAADWADVPDPSDGLTRRVSPAHGYPPQNAGTMPPIVPPVMPASVPSPVSSSRHPADARSSAPMPPTSTLTGTRRAARSPAPADRENLGVLMVAIFALAATLMTGLLGFVGVRLLTTAREAGTGPFAAMPASTDGPTPTPTLTIPTFAPEPTLTPTLGVQIMPWNGQERFTILLLGLDKRPYENGTAFRTDSMILLSLDPATRSIGMLSIPRDLYVEIPRDTVVRNYYGLQRVNTAYFIGESVQIGYGPKLAMQTVQYNLGIRVHDYVVYDFEAVIAAIDAVGGVEIDVERAIVDYQYPDMFGGYETLRIAPGRQTMDGTLALKYARTRHGTSDIDRARRQQQVIQAVRSRVLNLNMLPELLIRAPGLWAQWSRHVQSGLSLDQILQLLVYAKDIPAASIRQGVIDFSYVQSVTWNGAAVLVPNRASIGPLLVQVFGPNYNN